MGVAGWGETRVNGQRLAVELRRLRDLAGLSGRELAQRIGVSQSKVSRIESGSAIPTSGEVGAWADAVSAPAGTRELLLELTEQALTEVYAWKEALRDRTHLQDDIQQREREARRICGFQPTLVPGLLQTAEYARRVFTMFHPPYAERDIPAVVAGRLDRQLALYEEGREFSFLLTEAALRWRAGPPSILRAQLDRIGSVSTLENVSVGVIPHAVEALTSVPHGFVILGEDDESDAATGGADGEQEVRVIVETIHASLTVRGEHVAVYRHQWSLLEQMAVFGDEARSFLAGLAADLGRTR
ncbi:helix-turn-helix transcriptional regulator [Frankia sp. CiP3]|uniref:helix-turn-helix domain-containing protein n=1 Tax=Frankia sp. CiP3 TaxID=2880971 RepID=UPI001EF635BA|nr:helix-turn-helix transcriptional regulator [Frankia sp. CiP3]